MFFGKKKLLQKIEGLELGQKALQRNYSSAVSELEGSRERVSQLESELKVLRFIGPRILKVDIEDPEPTDENLRNTYVAAVSLFFDEYLRKKLLRMIAEVREELDTVAGPDSSRVQELPPGTTRAEFDWFLRGTTNALKLVLDWGERMQNERAAFIQRQKETDVASKN